MVDSFETYSVACYAYFTAEQTLGQFENLVFVIMSTILGKIYALSLELLWTARQHGDNSILYV